MHSPVTRRPFTLQSVLLLLLSVCISWRLLAVLLELHLSQRHLIAAAAIGAVVGVLAARGLFSVGRRLHGVSLGLAAWSISVVAYAVFGLGIPVEWMIE